MKTLKEYLKLDPTIINHEDDGQIRSLVWLNNDVMHSHKDHPAYVSIYPNGIVHIEAWYTNGVEHRANGPALITYSEKGRIKHKVWYTNGVVHRKNHPAFIEYYTTLAQSIKRVEYRSNGKTHRSNGPAVIKYTTLGKILNERWYTKGVMDSQISNIFINLER